MSELLARWSARELIEIEALMLIEQEEDEERALEAKAQAGLEAAKARPRL